MSGFEQTALDALLMVATAAWVVGLTYVAFRLFDRLVVRPLRGGGSASGRPRGTRLPVVVRRGGHDLGGRGNGPTLHRAR